MSKIINLNKLALIFKKHRKQKKIVLCHGVFDVLHHGHIKYFEEAKKKGDILVVSLTADEFVNKGPGRPYFNFKYRSETLEAIQTIDYICKSKFDTSLEVIKLLKPDFYCKGMDYKNKKKDLTKNIFLEKKAVEKSGGKFITTSSKLFSSSNIINSKLDFFTEEQKRSVSKIKKISNFNKIVSDINNLKNKKILVIGEVIIDEYVFCDALGKSGKEPFLALKKNRVERYLGGSGAIAMHLRDFVKQIDILSYKGESTKDNNFIKKILEKVPQLSKEFFDSINDLKIYPIFVSHDFFEFNNNNIHLIGDAFFAFSPSFAQGASQSIEGAYELFENIENSTESNFFKNRVNKTKMVNNRSKFNQFTFHLSNPLNIFVRNIFLKRLVKNKKFLESYLGKIYR